MDYKIFDTAEEAKQYKHDGKYNKRETIDGKWAVQCPEGTETPEFPEIQDETE